MFFNGSSIVVRSNFCSSSHMRHAVCESSISLHTLPIKRALAILALVGTVALSATASDNIRGWYEVGANVVEDAKLEQFFDQSVSDNKVKFDPGFRGAIALGTDITRFFAVEVEG